MQPFITVGPEAGSLEQALRESKSGTMLILNPGKYRVSNRIISKQLLLRGTGQNATDVVIEGTFQAKGKLQLENLMIQQTTTHNNLVSLSEGAKLTAKGVVFHNLGGPAASIYLNHASLTLIACTVRQTDGERRGIVADKHSEILLDRSEVQFVQVSETTITAKSSLLRLALLIRDNSVLNADTLYLADYNSKYYAMNGENHAEIKIDDLELPAGETRTVFGESTVQIGKTNIDPTHRLIAHTDEGATVGIPGAQIRPINGSVNETPTTKPATVVSATVNVEPQRKSAELQANAPKRAIDQLNEMIGLASVKQQVNQFIELAKFNKRRETLGISQVSQSLHATFCGNPGTGKTTVARLVAKAMYEEGVMPNDTYVEVTRQDLVSQYVGGTAVKTQKVLEKALGGVLFVDEAYSLYQADGSSNWGQEAVDTILKFMEDHRNDLMIIFAGYPKEMADFISMNPGLESRIANHFEFADYTPEEVAEIGVRALTQQEFKFDEANYRQAVIKAYQADISHSNGRWIRNFNDKLIRIMAEHAMNTSNRDTVTILNSDIAELVDGGQTDKAQAVKMLLAQLDDMVGLESVKKFVHNLVSQVVVSQRFGDQLGEVEPTYHMTFTGDPGTGKTTVARLIAQLFFNLDILPKNTVSEVSRTDLVGAYVGQTEEKTSKVIRNALGGVLFIDEAYQLTSGQGSNDFGQQAVETMITALENQRNEFVAIFAGYTKEMQQFLSANPGLRSRIPLNIEFEPYSATEVGQIVDQIVGKNFQVNHDLLIQVVTQRYQALPSDERSNGRWARNFADQLIAHHKLWLSDRLDQVKNVKQINDDVVSASLDWKI